jgi:hypothetical protein
MTITGANGEDAEQAIAAGISEYGKRVTREATTAWHTAAQERLMEAAGGRSDLDDTRDMRGSLEGRQSNDLHKLAEAFTPPVWNADDQQWEFACTHAMAPMHEWGAMPHEIQAKQAQALVFEWPDAPEEIEEQFADTFPTVFFDSIEHPGVPAIGYMRYGRQQARKRLEAMGLSTTGFAERSDGGDGDG